MTSAGQAEGAWIFVSHSHKDLQKVRRIRNALEAQGHNPLLFFLKCLDDDSGLDDLIRREIEARKWFILCDSPNAKTSRWVQEEVKIIKSLEDKVVEVIDLDEDLDIQVERVSALSRRATVFISYSRADTEVAQQLRDALLEHDFRVFFDVESLSPGTAWETAIVEAIDRAVREGFFLFLLSPEALRSRWVREEVRIALDRAAFGRRSNIVPILVRGDLSTLFSHEGLGDAIARIQFFDLTRGDRAERIAELVESLKTREMESPAPADSVE